MVPPRSDRVSRAPPYSRTPARPCPYGAVTRYGAPFQTLPVRKAEATGLVRVRSSLLTESRVDVLSSGYLDISVRRVRLLPLSIHDRIPPKGWVAPFGDLGITGRSPLPRAFRSVPRPSSPLGAKASTRCPSRARPRPAPRPRLRGQRQSQRSEIRPAGLPCTLLCPPEPMRQHRPYQGCPGVSAYPCPGTTDPPRKTRGSEAASPVMPASRSRLASRCQNVSRPTPPCRARAPISSVRAAPGTAAPSPRSHPRLLVGLGRFERPTSRLSGVRSNQLSYRPGCRGQRSEIRRHPRQNLLSDLCSLSSGRDAPAAAGVRLAIPQGCPSLAAGPGGPAMVAAKRAWQPLERR